MFFTYSTWGIEIGFLFQWVCPVFLYSAAWCSYITLSIYLQMINQTSTDLTVDLQVRRIQEHIYLLYQQTLQSILNKQVKIKQTIWTRSPVYLTDRFEPPNDTELESNNALNMLDPRRDDRCKQFRSRWDAA